MTEKRREFNAEFLNHGNYGSRLAWSSSDTEGLGKLPSDEITI